MIPIDDNVVIEPITEEVNSKLYLTAETKKALSKSDLKKGKVIFVGPGCAGVNMQVEPGHIVLYSTFADVIIKYNDNNYLIMRQTEIKVIVGKETTVADNKVKSSKNAPKN